MKDCKGKDCSTMHGNEHSMDCMFEHFLSYAGDGNADNSLIGKLRKAYFDGAATAESELESLKRERAMLVEEMQKLILCADNLGHCEGGQDGKSELDNASLSATQAISATSEQSAQWLAEHDAKVLEDAAQYFESVNDQFVNPDRHVEKTLCRMASELRLAASKRKEQV